MSYKILCSTQLPNTNLEGLVKDEDKLSLRELKRRDELADLGITECKGLLDKQESSEMFYFYEGSIEGFQECKKYLKFSEFEKRLIELNAGEVREIACNIKDKSIREMVGIYDPNEKMDINEVWKIKGKRVQIEFVYKRLKASRMVYRLMEKHISKFK